MYVAITGKGKSRVIQFREDKRIPNTNKKKCKVIKTIGNYEKMLAENPNIIAELKEEAKRLTKEKKLQNAPITLTISNQEIIHEKDSLKSYKFGHCIVNKIWKDMKLDKYFKGLDKKNSDDLEKVILSLVMHRICNPKSVLSTYNDIENYAGFTKDGLDLWYRCLDVLGENESNLINHLCNYFEKNIERKKSYAYYDVTTYAFESVKQGNLRLFGYSKDHKNNEVQVVMGLLIDNNGIPISYTLFPGNTMDQNTLVDAVEDIKDRYNLEKVVIIADRGLNGKENLEFLTKENHDFVIAYTLKKSNAEIKKLALDNNGWENVKYSDDGEVLFRKKTLDYVLKVKVELTEEEKEKLPKKRGRKRKYKTVEIDTKIHLTWCKKRADKDRADRERTLKKAQEIIENPYKLKNGVKRGRNQYVEFEVDTENLKLDEQKILEKEKFDGYYAIITNNKDYETDEVVQMYRGLWKIEESFRVLKTDLKARPVYVWSDNRIKGHFSLCYISLCIVRYLQYLHEKELGENISAERLKTAINSPGVVVFGKEPDNILIPNNITEDYLKLHKLVGLKPLRTSMTVSEFKNSTKLNMASSINSNRT